MINLAKFLANFTNLHAGKMLSVSKAVCFKKVCQLFQLDFMVFQEVLQLAQRVFRLFQPVFLESFSKFSIDGCEARYFHTSFQLVQLTLPLFLVGVLVGIANFSTISTSFLSKASVAACKARIIHPAFWLIQLVSFLFLLRFSVGPANFSTVSTGNFEIIFKNPLLPVKLFFIFKKTFAGVA